jgi:hypothetical protein
MTGPQFLFRQGTTGFCLRTLLANLLSALNRSL